MSPSQRIALWVLEARQVGVSRCKKCGGTRIGSYDPDRRHGLGIFDRCWNCGSVKLVWCQPNGSRRPFEPPRSWTEEEAEAAAAEARAIERQIQAAVEAEKDEPTEEPTHAA